LWRKRSRAHATITGTHLQRCGELLPLLVGLYVPAATLNICGQMLLGALTYMLRMV
jgi:hypothetical protein